MLHHQNNKKSGFVARDGEDKWRQQCIAGRRRMDGKRCSLRSTGAGRGALLGG